MKLAIKSRTSASL